MQRLRRSVVLVSTILGLLPARGTAQSGLPSVALRPVTAPVRDAGVYHLTTHTWTRHGGGASLGADVLYDNTCPSGFYSPLSGFTYTDEGRLPSATSPHSATSIPGCATSYTVRGFTISYCTDDPNGLGTATFDFYEQGAPCQNQSGATPTATFAFSGLPGCTTGTLSCWIATIDLDSPPQPTSLAFTLRADGDGTYQAVPQDHFQWSISSSITTSMNTGPVLAGDPATCPYGAGTRFDPAQPGPGTGLGAVDSFRIDVPGGCYLCGCHFFGGWPANPFASFYLRLHGDACARLPEPGQSFCPGVACPCGNDGGAVSGCSNSQGTSASLAATGIASLAHDSLELDVEGLTSGGTSALFFQGTQRVNGGAGTAFGDGLRCAGGNVVRIGARTLAIGVSTTQYPATGDPSVSVRGQITAPGLRDYQVWYRNNASFCTSASFNLSNGYEVLWSP